MSILAREENQIPFVDDEDDETIPEPPKKTSRTVSSTGALSGGKRGGRKSGGEECKAASREILCGMGNNYSELSSIYYHQKWKITSHSIILRIHTSLGRAGIWMVVLWSKAIVRYGRSYVKQYRSMGSCHGDDE